jgi:hypothetical protein
MTKTAKSKYLALLLAFSLLDNQPQPLEPDSSFFPGARLPWIMTACSRSY